MMLIERVHTHVIVPSTNVLGMPYILAKSFLGCKIFLRSGAKKFVFFQNKVDLIACADVYHVLQGLLCQVVVEIPETDIPNMCFCGGFVIEADTGDMGRQ